MTLRTSPLDAAHRALHAKMVPFGGWDMPLSYPDGTIAEHKACRHGAVAFDVSHLGTVRVEGPDALHQLQRALTNDLTRIGPGRAQYTHLLDPADASVLDDIIVWWVGPETFDVMPNASNTDRVTEALAGGDDTTVVDVTPTRAIIAVQGPEARRRLADGVARGGRGRAVPRRPGALGERRPGRGRHRLHRRGRRRAGRAGRGRRAAVDRPARGRASSPPAWAPATPCGSRPACPLHGHELGPGITSLQAGLGWVVRWDKGDFRGRDALLAEKEAGVSRRLRGLAVEGRKPPRAEQVVLRDGAPVGVVTSGNFSPELGHGIALAFVPPDVEIGDHADHRHAGHRGGGRGREAAVREPAVSRS